MFRAGNLCGVLQTENKLDLKRAGNVYKLRTLISLFVDSAGWSRGRAGGLRLAASTVSLRSEADQAGGQ